MKVEKAMLVLAAVIFTAGCEQRKAVVVTAPASAASPAASALISPASGAATVAVCAMSNQVADTCAVRKAGSADEYLVCHAWVGGPRVRPFVYPYEMVVPTAAAGTPVYVVWHLLDQGLRFPSAASGPTMPRVVATGASGPFSDGSPTSDDEGQTLTADPGARHFRWKFIHPGANVTYNYTMQYEFLIPRTTNWVGVSCDPTIRSSGN